MDKKFALYPNLLWQESSKELLTSPLASPFQTLSTGSLQEESCKYNYSQFTKSSIWRISLRTSYLKGFTSVSASISWSTFNAQVSSASLQRATSQARSLSLREVSISSQDVWRGRKKSLCVYEREAYGLDLCPHKQEPTLQLVSLRSDLPSCRITLETFRSCCALADSWRLLLVHSDTLWRRPGFAGSADILWLGNVAKIVTVSKWTA